MGMQDYWGKVRLQGYLSDAQRVNVDLRNVDNVDRVKHIDFISFSELFECPTSSFRSSSFNSNLAKLILFSGCGICGPPPQQSSTGT
jgi:hypothetical protein